MADTVGSLSSPLVHHGAVTNLGVVSRLRSLDFYLFVLNVYIMFSHGLIHSCIVFKAKEAKPSGLLFLLVVHDDHLRHSAVATEEVPQICLSDAGRKSPEEHLGPVDVFLRLLHGPRVARLGINRPSVKIVWTALYHGVDVIWVTERHKSKSSRSASFCIFHNHTVYDLTKPGEISEKTILCGFPGEPTNEQFSFLLILMFVVFSSPGRSASSSSHPTASILSDLTESHHLQHDTTAMDLDFLQ